MSTADPRDRQPYRPANPKQSHRRYVPATWAEPGEGGGAPKESGGYTVDTRTSGPAPRAFNRPDQRYLLSVTEAQTRRNDRAAAEYADTVILAGDNGLIEVRSSSGNNYDVDHDRAFCDCPDHWRLSQSYVVDVKCKHRVMVETAIAAVGGYANLDWSCDRVAEELGLDRRTVEALCEEGFFDAVKIHQVWVISNGGTLPVQIAAYRDKIIGDPESTIATLTAADVIRILA